MPVPEHDPAIAEYVGKWHAREPEMVTGELFVPAGARALFRRWGALQAELREAAHELSDPRVTAAKAGWWAEELAALSEGRPRHPLTRGMVVEAAVPWRQLAMAVAAVVGEASDGIDRPADPEAALSGVHGLSSALAACEDALFGAAGGAASARTIAVHLLLHRLLVGVGSADAGRVPLNLMARHGVTADVLQGPEGAPLRRAWAAELRARLEALPARASHFRHLSHAFDAARLTRLARDGRLGPAPGLATVWLAWRASRRALS